MKVFLFIIAALAALVGVLAFFAQMMSDAPEDDTGAGVSRWCLDIILGALALAFFL